MTRLLKRFIASSEHSTLEERKVASVLLVLLIICVAAFLRLYQIEADPDHRISGDPGIFSDEALYALSARNLALFGNFNPNHSSLVVEAVNSPSYTYAEYLSFKLFGVNIRALRIPSIFFSLLTIIVAYLFVKRLFGLKAAVFTTTFLALNYTFVQHNRLGLLETLLSFLILIFCYYSSTNENSGRIGLFVSGIFYGLALITKGTALFFLPGFFLFVALRKVETGWWKKSPIDLACFVGGIGVCLILNELYLFFLTHSGLGGIDVTTALASSNLMDRGRENFLSGSVGDWIKSLTQILVSRFSMSMPLVFFSAYFYSFWFIATRKRPLSSQDRAELLLILWVFSGICFMSFFTNIMSRYRVPLIPPICILGAICLSKIASIPNGKIAFLWNRRILWVTALGLGLLIFRLIRIVTVGRGDYWGNNLIVIVAIVVSFICILAVRKVLKFEFAVSNTLKTGLILCFLFLFISFQLTQYFRWSVRPVYNIKMGNQQIQKYVQSGIVGGMYAPILCFESNNIALHLWGGNLENLQKLGLTHYLDSVHGEPNSDFIKLQRRYPDFLKGSTHIFDIRLGTTDVSLYALSPSVGK